MKELYVDANIFLNYWFDEFSKTAEAYYAQQLFDKALGCEFSFVITTLVLDELSSRSGLSVEEINEKWFPMLIRSGKVRIERISQEVINGAVRLERTFKIPRKDAIHASFCLINNLPIITRDRHFFSVALLKVFVPENL